MSAHLLIITPDFPAFVNDFLPLTRSCTINSGEIGCLLKLSQDFRIMANGEQRGVVFVTNLADKRYGFVGVMKIQISCRFVGKYQSRPVGNGACNGNTLLLPDGQLRWPIPYAIAKPHPLKHVLREICINPLPKHHAEHDVFQRGVTGEQIEGLEDVANVAGTQSVTPGLREGCHLLASNNDASAIGLQNSGDEIEKRRFSGAATSPERNLRTFLHLEMGNVMMGVWDLQAKRKPFGG